MIARIIGRHFKREIERIVVAEVDLTVLLILIVALRRIAAMMPTATDVVLHFPLDCLRVKRATGRVRAID